MQKNRLNSSAENSGKKKAAEQILISTHNAAIKDKLRGGSTSYVQKGKTCIGEKTVVGKDSSLKNITLTAKSNTGTEKHIRKSSKCYRVSKRFAYST